MATETEKEAEIHAHSDSLRGADGVKREATEAESATMKVLKQELDDLRNPAPPPPPPLTVAQIRQRQLSTKHQGQNLNLAELNELIRGRPF